MGREEDLKRQHMARVQQDFTKAVHSGMVTIKDRFGRSLHPGDVVLFDTPQTPVMQITDIAPVLDPRLPAGLVLVTMTSFDQQMMKPNVPIPALVALPEATAALRKEQQEAEAGAAVAAGSAPTTDGQPGAEPAPAMPPDAPPPESNLVITDRFTKTEE